MSHERIIELFNKSTNPEQDEHLSLLSRMEELSLPDQGEQTQTPREDYTVYIGRPRTPFSDIDDPHTQIVPACTGVCGNVLILHGMESNTCMWIWVSETKDRESREVVLRKEMERFPRCQYRCDVLVDKKKTGVLRAAECERFEKIVEERPAWTGFVYGVLKACSEEEVLRKEGVRNALFACGVSSMSF
ncbi:uncharacterized protein APUU_60308S [Aspergillus puulaauensis]|uniref:Uncharacterized protein n=1 Tax=Aspergillus puulaauensis TaxID=1220207 RepID=A0A7R7XT59_9EURO|nr:uncharacterized protein APUU_60308S [Aspergillus puulaauensis]BCS27260.1 hypothetical protein APUU_60308S [Aspergillus puulaauensis]